ncbi:MAG: glycosyltransferase [Candidatus Bathyarchaeia archaeon]
MKNKIRITIGLCVKNDELSIKKCLEGILSQDFPHNQMELIVVDGNSTDKTLPIIMNTLTKANFTFLVLQENVGLSFARQLVVDHAKGEYILFVDGDMMLPRDYLLKMVKFMDENPGVAIAGGKFKMIMLKENGLVYKLSYLEKMVEHYFGDYSKEVLIGTGGSIFRVKAIADVGGFDVNIKGAGEDLELAYRIKNRGWKLYNVSYEFYDVPESDTGWKKNWKSLWKHYYWYGFNYCYVYRKHPKMFNISTIIPIFSLINGFLCFLKAFKLTRMKTSILLPLYFLFRQIAWAYAFTMAHFSL